MLTRYRIFVCVLLVFFMGFIKAEYLIYKHNPELLSEEDHYLTLELNDINWLEADEIVVLEKFQQMRSDLERESTVSFKIQVVRILLVLAQILDDNQKIREIFEIYFDKYADFDKKNSYYLMGSYCTFRQINEEDKTQSECFKKALKLYTENYILKIFNDPFYAKSYKGYFQRYQIAIIDYFAGNRKYSTQLCEVILDYENNVNEKKQSDYEDFRYTVKNDLNNYKYIGGLSEDDYETFSCLSDFE